MRSATKNKIKSLIYVKTSRFQQGRTTKSPVFIRNEECQMFAVFPTGANDLLLFKLQSTCFSFQLCFAMRTMADFAIESMASYKKD